LRKILKADPHQSDNHSPSSPQVIRHHPLLG
jgi:hypothetical protein